MIREQVCRAERRRLEGRNDPQQAMSSLPLSAEGVSTYPPKASRLYITGLRDANIQAYCEWQQPQGNESWKDEFRKACEIDELSDLVYFKAQADIRYWVHNYYVMWMGKEALIA
ncbi:hypothetical protein BDV10DRAFT_195140 [Aspergillus recurvatus]